MDHDFTKYAAAGLILILFCLYFSGCTASDPAFSQEAAPLVQSPGAIHALKPYDQDGYYTISHLGNSTLFTYIDFSNAVTIPLCSSASCSHTSESCPTYIGVGNSSWSPLIDDLTILDENSICYPLYNAPSGITKWYTADRDGGNRQPICIHDSKLVDDHFFYFNLEIPREGGSTPANSIFREPLNGGDAELILESDGAIWFLGGIDRWIIFFRADYESSLQQISLLNADTGELRELASWNSTIRPENLTLLRDNQIFWIDPAAPSQLHRLSLDGSELQIGIQWPDEIDPAKNLIVLEELADDQIILTVTVPHHTPRGGHYSHRYAVNVENGTVSEISLFRMDGAEKIPIEIAAATEKDLLVHLYNRPDTALFTGTDGMLYPREEMFNIYGLISKKDFLASTPNYREIQSPLKIVTLRPTNF